MARRRLWRNDVVRSYWRTRHPLLRFLCLHEAVTLPFVVAISDPTTTLAIIHLHFGDCLSGTLPSWGWSAMEFRRCISPCARFIAREDPHSKCILCLGFSHAREAVYGTSNCKICDDFRLITLRSRLEDYERESSNFSRLASSTSAPPRKIRELGLGCRARGDGEWADRPRLFSPSLSRVRTCEFAGRIFAWFSPEAVKELRRATDLALRATKHTARAVGRSVAASVAAECHLWLNLTEIREKEKVFLMDAPISQSGLFG